MTSTLIRGIIPTVLTPFDEAEQVDVVALQAQLQYLLQSGVHGLVVMGSFGECPYLDERDREIVIRTAVEAVNAAGRRVPIMVGICAYSTFVAAEQLRKAKHLGAQAAMVFLPQYFKLGFEEVRRHYAKLGELNVLPVFYYHYPAVNGLKFNANQIAELLSLSNVVGIKETTFDLHAVRQHIDSTGSVEKTFLAGSELVFSQFMKLGGHGVVGTAALIMPRTACSMYDAYISGEVERAKELQALLFETMPLARDVRASVSLVRRAFLLAVRQGIDIALDTAPTVSRLKAALARRGLPIQPITRAPQARWSEHDGQAVDRAMAVIEQIEAGAAGT